MGFGFLESVYKKCMIIELKKSGLNAESEKQIAVTHQNEIVGEFSADIMVEDIVIIELKSVKRIVIAHEIQLVNYLTATGKPIGLILNFGERKVEVKRKKYGNTKSFRHVKSWCSFWASDRQMAPENEALYLWGPKRRAHY